MSLYKRGKLSGSQHIVKPYSFHDLGHRLGTPTIVVVEVIEVQDGDEGESSSSQQQSYGSDCKGGRGVA